MVLDNKKRVIWIKNRDIDWNGFEDLPKRELLLFVVQEENDFIIWKKTIWRPLEMVMT
jgi:hypothetical protein